MKGLIYMEEKLADVIVNNSLKIKKNDRVLINYQSTKCNNLIKELIKKITDNKGIVTTNYQDIEILSIIKENINDLGIDLLESRGNFEIDNYDVFISIVYNKNDYESKNISNEISTNILERTSDIHNKKVNERRWILLNYPSILDAYKCNMKIDEFYNFSMKSMIMDYNDLFNRLKPLKELMENTNMVRITSPNTDISFSIKNMPIIPCVGEFNLPDGELYAAPIKDSVNGFITYNTTSTYRGEVFKNIRLEFKDGKIVNAITEESKMKKLNEIFDTDEGSRYIGEFSFGLNPLILEPMGDILFDEKIKGSIHFTPGASYKNCYNGNDSNIHWDLVLIQRIEYGGGEIYFDDILIRKDGEFVLKELELLNYKNIKVDKN